MADKIHDRQARDLPKNAITAPAVVDDPLERGSKLTVLRSVRDDPLAGMLARGLIDQAHFEAGRLWQKHHEAAEVGSVSAIDPTKEAVDGGRFPELLGDRQRKAVWALGEADRELGPFGSALIRSVLGTRLSIAEVAQQHRYSTERQIKYISLRFRECLETLARLWGFAGRA